MRGQRNRISNLILIVSIVLAIGAIFVTHAIAQVFPFENIEDEELPYSHCASNNTAFTANCLRDYVATFYDYKMRTDISRSLENIQQNGGDCFDYAHLYKIMAKDLGYYGHVARFQTSDSRYGWHAVAIMAGNDYYCILDQISPVKCVGIGSLDDLLLMEAEE